MRINRDLAQARQVNHQATIACAKACQAVPSASNGGKNSGFRGGSNRTLHIAYIGTPRDKPRPAGHHAIPNDTCVFVGAVAGAQQITLEAAVERREDVFADFDHLVFSLSSELLDLGYALR
jgi:hypothetical protein